MSTESVKSFIPALSPLPDNAEESLTLDFILPRLLYIGDVPITATISGAALLYRLLEDYPSDRLVIAQGNIWSEQPEWGHGDSSKSLSNVRYETLAVGRSRLLHSRFAKVYAAHLQLTARLRARTVNTLVKTFHPEAILTVAHGFSWVTAAAVAESLRIPLHLIVHDDWVSCNHLSNRMREFGRGQFAKVYRQAKTRFCASPYMAEEYERRYGINGTVLYPSQSTFTPVFESSCDSETQHFPTVSYAGTINSGGYAQSILNLAKVLEKFSGRVLLFSPHSKNELANFGLDRPNIVAHPLLDHHHLVEHLRKESDVLFIPMSFEPSDNQNMKELRAHNHEVYCVNSSWNNGEFGRLINEAEIPAKELPLGFISKTLSWSAIRMTLDQLQRVPSLWWNYRKLLRAFKPQVVVHSNFHHLILLWPLLSGTTNVFHVHDSFQPTRFYRVVLKLLEMRLRLFIGVSKFVAQSLVDLGMPRTKVAHVLNGIAEVHPSDKLKPLAAGRHDPLRIGIIGQVGQWKGHDLLVDALQLLKSRGDRFVCRIFGDGDPIYSAALKDKIIGSGLSYEMEWKGFVIDKNSIYSSIDLCVVPSRALEPFGMVAAEASLHACVSRSTHPTSE